MSGIRLSLLVLSTFFAAGSHAQTVMHCVLGEDVLPVMSMKGRTPYVFTGDSLERGKAEGLIMLPAEDFGRGFVDLEIRENHRDGVYNDGGVLRFTSGRSWYIFLATITPDRDLEDVYCSMVFDTYGRKSHYAKSIGELEAGKSRTVRIFIKLGYEMPQEFHIYAGGEEIRTSLIPERYVHENGLLVFDSELRDPSDSRVDSSDAVLADF